MEVGCCLPADVLLETFSRLPKKERLRCEAVSKNWQNLIRKIASFSIARALECGFVRYTNKLKQFDFYRLDDKGALHLQDSLVIPSRQAVFGVGSCNGLLYFHKDDRSARIRKLNIQLYNPVTGHLTTIPPPPCFSTRDLPMQTGFVPDPETNHYKFLLVYPIHHPLGFAMFNSQTRAWKTHGAPLEPYGMLAAALCWRGTLYWFRSKQLLGVFSMKTETFRRLPLPTTQKHYYGVLWESAGSVHYCLFSEIKGICIWVLEDDNTAGSDSNKSTTTWRKIYCVAETTLNSILAQTDIGPVPRSDSRRRRRIRIKYVSSFNEHLQILLLKTSKGFVWYDISTKTMSPVSGRLRGFFLPFTYNNMELPDITSRKQRRKRHRWRSI